jgi:hypothetical protein
MPSARLKVLRALAPPSLRPLNRPGSAAVAIMRQSPLARDQCSRFGGSGWCGRRNDRVPRLPRGRLVPRLVRHDVGVDRAEALLASTSEDWSERAAAARVLAEALDDETRPALLRLLSDHENTAVVQVAAESLLARRDGLGIDLFCVAYAQADDELGDHLNDSLLAVPQQPENLSLMREAAQRGVPGAIQALQWLRLGP